MKNSKVEHTLASSGSTSSDALSELAQRLGPLPPRIRYFDEYQEKVLSISAVDDNWRIDANGRVVTLKFGLFNADEATVLKHFCTSRLHKNAVTASSLLWSFIATGEWQIPLLRLAAKDPRQTIDFLRSDFRSFSGLGLNEKYFEAAKALLYFFCDRELCGWNSSYANILRSVSSPVVKADLRTVRDGSAIITLEEEHRIVAYFDELNLRICHTGCHNITDSELRDACILFWAYAHGMRPIQIANRNGNHMKLRKQDDGNPIIHLTFRYAKQRSDAKMAEQTRKMKRDWTPMLAEWFERRKGIDRETTFDRGESLFGVAPSAITQIIADLTKRVTGVRRVPYDLRHSAAQRKADAGCSRIELAEFLMHRDIETAAAYIEMSPTQAEKINQALGLSPLFQEIDKAIKSRSVDRAELNRMPDDRQIGAAPHGHLIAGIGGCAIGQSFCTKTPALSCYECSKFMYLRDVETHRSARESVHQIIEEFIGVGRADRVSPAFMQLRRVVETIDAIIEDLDSSIKEQPNEQD